MNFPDKLTVTVRNGAAGVPVNGVAIVLVLFASTKNDYHIGPQITNEQGQAEFTRAQCETAIKRIQEMFVMDYAGNLQSCRPLIEVRLHAPERITLMLQQYNQSPEFWGKPFLNPKQLFAALENVKNADYEQAQVTATEEQLAENPTVELSLLKRAA